MESGEAVFGGNMRDINLLLEDIVYLELLRCGYVVTVGRSGDKEIDFVCDKRGEKLYVQVTYLLASEETIIREFGAYDNIHDNYPKYVVSLDELDMAPSPSIEPKLPCPSTSAMPFLKSCESTTSVS